MQQQRLQKGSRGSSFCGPDTEKHTSLDCISVSHQNIQDLHKNGSKMLHESVIFLHLRLQQSVTVFKLICHIAEGLWRDKMHFINLSCAMNWQQTSECIACIHLVTLSRSCSEVQMEEHCWRLQQLFILNNRQSKTNHFSFTTVLFGCLMGVESSSCCCWICRLPQAHVGQHVVWLSAASFHSWREHHHGSYCDWWQS